MRPKPHLPPAQRTPASLLTPLTVSEKILGDYQDSVVTRDLLRRLGAEAFVQGENGFSYGRLHALEQSIALDAEARFHREWKKFATPSL
jgi:hypothetical protein